MEILDIVDENGIPTGETVERERAHAEGIRHRTSHVWLLRKRNDRIEVLLQKRSSNKDSFPDCYDISSAGHIPAGVDFVPSAIRELKEELGVDAKETELFVCGNRSIDGNSIFHGKPFLDRQYSRVFAMWCDKNEDEFTLQKEEVSAVRWMEINEALEAVKENKIKSCIFLPELLMVKNAAENKGE